MCSTHVLHAVHMLVLLICRQLRTKLTNIAIFMYLMVQLVICVMRIVRAWSTRMGQITKASCKLDSGHVFLAVWLCKACFIRNDSGSFWYVLKFMDYTKPSCHCVHYLHVPGGMLRRALTKLKKMQKNSQNRPIVRKAMTHIRKNNNRILCVQMK